ncbi:D-dopachrome decarboxylase-like [Adelges cooleyi]|uniref:D-dopachrome decarboxylase-like n=1 Tax=Adelges cooleyi TaxID=133065 RepID=UPI00217F3A52|nr:D-dopachrome decarboxylase-like [Adelges cooleyi]
MSYTIDTNLGPGQIPEDFLSETSDFLSALFDRPKKVIMGQLRSGQRFDFSGSDAPCAVMHITRGSLKPGTVAEEAVKYYVAAISEYFQKNLGLDSTRVMIFYHEHDLAMMGNAGKTLKCFWDGIGPFPTTK